MLFADGRVRVWLCTAPVDMRKSYDGLAALVKHHLGDDPLSGHLFAFVNRRATQIKILGFDRTGYAIWSKRLEQGRFVVDHRHGAPKRALTMTELQCLLDGIELRDAHTYKRFVLPERGAP